MTELIEACTAPSLQPFLTFSYLAMIIYGSYWVFKLAKLSEHWRSIWMLWGVYIICGPIIRPLVSFFMAECPNTPGEFLLRLWLPQLGGMCYILAMMKLYKVFEKWT